MQIKSQRIIADITIVICYVMNIIFSNYFIKIYGSKHLRVLVLLLLVVSIIILNRIYIKRRVSNEKFILYCMFVIAFIFIVLMIFLKESCMYLLSMKIDNFIGI
jgi:glucan phosphoethanolaminetransferase (alkaline phosphatase superfamily)